MTATTAVELRVPAAGLPRWGDGTRALCEAVGGRWPVDQTLRMQLCHLVAYRVDRDVWEVDDPIRFARLAGARILDDQAIEVPLIPDGA